MSDYILKAENIQVDYIGGYSGIKDISLYILPNNCLLVYGMEKSGKTTLLRALSGLEKIQKGNILLKGTDIDKVLPKDRNIGFSFGFESLKADKKAIDIIAYPMKLRNLSESEINDRISHINAVIDIDLEKKVKNMSISEKAKLILARLFSIQRELYLLDDLTKNLNDEEKSDYYCKLESLIKDKTVVIASDDKDFALKKFKDNVLIITDGIAKCQGRIDDICKLPFSMQCASICGYELHIGKLIKKDNEYFALVGDDMSNVEKPINDIYVDKEVCFCKKDNIIMPFYYDLNCERLISYTK